MAIPVFPAKKVEPLRRALDLSQQQLADRIGVGRALVSLWEIGLRKPRGPAAKLLAQLAAEAELTTEEKKTSNSA